MIWTSVINEFRQRMGLDSLTTPEPVFTAFIDTFGHLSIERVEQREAGFVEILVVAMREYQVHEQPGKVAKAFEITNMKNEMQGYFPAVIGYQSNYVGYVVRLREDDFSIQRLEQTLMFLDKLLGLLDEY